MNKSLSLPWTIVVGALALGVACGPPEEVDLDPPRVVEVTPAGPIVETDAAFTIQFSEPIAVERVTDEPSMIVLIPAVYVDATFHTDIENPPLIDSRQARVIPTEKEFASDGLSVTLIPDGNLAAGTRYAIVVSADVRDRAGNPIVDTTGTKANFVFEVTTDAGPPEAISVSAQGTVPANLKRVRVTFNQPINGISKDAVFIDRLNDVDPEIAAIEVSSDRTVATLILADGPTCERLEPGAEFQVVIDGDMTDDAGRSVRRANFPFSAALACDLTPNRIVGATTSYGIAPEGYVFFSTSKASTTEVRFGVSGETLDCLFNTCPSLGEDARIIANGVYNHSAVFSGVQNDQVYDVLVRAEDDVGSIALTTTTIVITPAPSVSVNEILPNPIGEEDEGEFIEIVNHGDLAVDVSGFTIQVGERAPCTFDDDPILNLAAGQFLVVARDSFVSAQYPEGDASRVYSPPGCSQTELLLANDVVSIRLFDVLGRPVSVYAGYANLSPAAASKEGLSIERNAPDAPDENASFCFSPGAPSPGRQNGSVALGCD